MVTEKKIKYLTIEGFQSIKHLEKLELHSLNILIGANGAGKSNFVSYFRMLGEMAEQRLQVWVRQQGGSDRLLTYGIKETSQISSFIEFGDNGYKFILKPTVDGSFTFSEEKSYFDGNSGNIWRPLGSGHLEATLKSWSDKSRYSIERYCYDAISSWKVFHFHDTSDTAKVKRKGALQDNKYLRSDAENLAAYLYMLRNRHPDVYSQIRKVIQLAIPFFDDFILEPEEIRPDEYLIQLMWQQENSDYALLPSQLSDGSIRFICLATALLQPDPPSTIIIDEPELGLHPYAITLLGSLMRSASQKMQLIVSTQSVPLLDEFSIDDLIIVERENDVSTFKRLDEQEFSLWLEEYTVGELWEKNILGGRP
ncbi:MAG: AAA family ATPase [Phototrophicaceae bacterium]